MKRSLLISISAAAILLLSACGANKSDNNSEQTVSELNSAITNNDFAQAQGLNAALLNAGNKAGSTKAAAQLKYLAEAQQNIAENKYDKALTKLKKAQKIESNDAAIGGQITQLLKTVKTRKANVADATKAIDSSKQALANNDFALALQQIAPYQTSKYQTEAYHVIYTKVLETKANILASEKSSGTSITVSQANDSKASSTSTKSSATANDDDNAYSTSSSSSASNSNTAISSSDIEQARKDLTAAGEDQAAWSDGDIKTAITNARKDGRTHITANDLH